MATVMLPPVSWFLAGNVYSGSQRSDATQSALSQAVFEYTVKAERRGERAELVAFCRFVPPWNTVTLFEEAMLGRFEASEQGVEIAEQWLCVKGQIREQEARLPCYTRRNDNALLRASRRGA